LPLIASYLIQAYEIAGDFDSEIGDIISSRFRANLTHTADAALVASSFIFN
jgi:hypothetical protein